MVPQSHKVKSGDEVEILTSKSQHVQKAWINFVSTAKAKAKIQAILRRDSREIQHRGEEILDEFMQRNDIEVTTNVLDTLRTFHDLSNTDDLFLALGEKTIILGSKDIDEIQGKNKVSSSSNWRRYVPFFAKEKKKNSHEEESQQQLFVVGDKFDRKKPIYITEDSIGTFIFPSCCHPIPGDDVLGYINNKNQIEIHKRVCPVATKLKSSFGNRLLDARWDMHKKLFFDATVEIKGIDRIGLLKEVTTIISEQMNVNIHKLTISCDDGLFDGTLELRVHDRDDMKVIMDSLKKVEDLKEISQIL